MTPAPVDLIIPDAGPLISLAHADRSSARARPMQQSSAQNATFAHRETPHTLMHVGSVAIYDPSTAPGGFNGAMGNQVSAMLVGRCNLHQRRRLRAAMTRRASE